MLSLAHAKHPHKAIHTAQAASQRMETGRRSAIGLIARFFEAPRTQEPLFAVTSRHLTRFRVK